MMVTGRGRLGVSTSAAPPIPILIIIMMVLSNIYDIFYEPTQAFGYYNE